MNVSSTYIIPTRILAYRTQIITLSILTRQWNINVQTHTFYFLLRHVIAILCCFRRNNVRPKTYYRLGSKTYSAVSQPLIPLKGSAQHFIISNRHAVFQSCNNVQIHKRMLRPATCLTSSLFETA